MRRFATAIALTCVLAATVFAGDIPMVPGPPPPTPSANAPGDMGGGGIAQEITDEIVLAIFGIFTR
ncbi:MAG TPA: hypothetical protein VJS64_13785 [Pyrinomonadaceae bacterium]|nr:hypothetical protein [Pyrinomonadaceae bacterium]